MEETWTEAQYEAALAQLESLADKITALRTTIPSLISPLTRPAASRPAAFAGLKKSAVAAVTDVQDLRREWESLGVQDVLNKTKESYERDGELRAAADVAAWGWVKEVKEDVEEEKTNEEKEVKKEEGGGG